jgi:hypothetical protein
MIMGVTMLVASGWLGVTALGAEQAPKAAAKEANLSPEKGKEGTAAAVALLHQASELVRYARENESPEAMLTAAQMIGRVRVQEGTERVGAKRSEPAPQAAAASEGTKGNTPSPTLDTKQLLAEAKGWAKGNPHVVALIEAEATKAKPAAAGTLGASGGPIWRSDRVLAHSADNYTIVFRGGEVARIAVSGDGDTDLDLYVYDENGAQIASDRDSTDDCLVCWVPRWTGPFRVRVVNLGRVYNNYVLTTN